MLNIIKNDFYRILKQKGFLIIATLLTIVCMASAILITNKAIIKYNIAVVGAKQEIPISEESKNLDMSYLDEEPVMSSLVEGRYDAVIKFNENNDFEIKTTKNTEFKETLKDALLGKSSSNGSYEKERGVGASILGFCMMFILMQGIAYGKVFAEDKEKHITERVLAAPVKFSKYILGHGIFIFGLIFVPTMLVIIISSFLGVKIGFNLVQYTLLIGLLSSLSTSFALCIYSFFKDSDTPAMFGNTINILTSVLAGSFYSLSYGQGWFDKLLHILPQHDFMNYINALEKGDVNLNYYFQIMYVILVSVILLLIAVLKTRKDYIYKEN